MKQTKAKARGPDAFNSYFGNIYQERWPRLLEALKSEPSRCALLNPFAVLAPEETRKLQDSTTGRCDAPWKSENKLLSHYAMDRASVIGANALVLKEGDRVLDMCAAPGGKALSLIFRSNGNHFVLNERSATRRARLQKVIEEYVAEDRRAEIEITGHDATKWCLYEKDAYDAILLDAPCSSERHLLEKPALMAQWSPHRTYALALQQFAMLASAGAAVRAGGHILYATCSISPSENDEVIAKLLKKRDGFEIVALQFDEGEATKYGWIFMPDSTLMGPLYVSLVRRTLVGGQP